MKPFLLLVALGLLALPGWGQKAPKHKPMQLPAGWYFGNVLADVGHTHLLRLDADGTGIQIQRDCVLADTSRLRWAQQGDTLALVLHLAQVKLFGPLEAVQPISVPKGQIWIDLIRTDSLPAQFRVVLDCEQAYGLLQPFRVDTLPEVYRFCFAAASAGQNVFMISWREAGEVKRREIHQYQLGTGPSGYMRYGQFQLTNQITERYLLHWKRKAWALELLPALVHKGVAQYTSRSFLDRL